MAKFSRDTTHYLISPDKTQVVKVTTSEDYYFHYLQGWQPINAAEYAAFNQRGKDKPRMEKK